MESNFVLPLTTLLRRSLKPRIPAVKGVLIQTCVNLTLGALGMPLANGVPKHIITLAKAAKPVMPLDIRVVVGLIVASLILPVFKLSRAVNYRADKRNETH